MKSSAEEKTPRVMPIKAHSSYATRPHERDSNIDFKIQTLSAWHSHRYSCISINITEGVHVSSADFNEMVLQEIQEIREANIFEDVYTFMVVFK